MTPHVEFLVSLQLRPLYSLLRWLSLPLTLLIAKRALVHPYFSDVRLWQIAFSLGSSMLFILRCLFSSSSSTSQDIQPTSLYWNSIFNLLKQTCRILLKPNLHVLSFSLLFTFSFALLPCSIHSHYCHSLSLISWNNDLQASERSINSSSIYSFCSLLFGLSSDPSSAPLFLLPYNVYTLVKKYEIKILCFCSICFLGKYKQVLKDIW